MPPTHPPPTAPPQGLPDALQAARELLSGDPAAAVRRARALLADPDPRAAAHAQLLLGQGEYHQGHLEAALEPLEAALTHFREADEPALAREAALALGRALRDLGRFHDAAARFDTALAMARRERDAAAEIDTLNLQAGLFSTQGNHPRALELLQRALEVAQAHGSAERQANLLNNIGTLHTMLGDYPQALEHLTRAHDLFRRAGAASRSRASNLINLGHLYQDMNNDAEAKAFYLQARDAGRDGHEPLVEAAALNNLANVHLRAEDFAGARAAFEEALAIARLAGARQYQIDNLDGLGQVHLALREFDAALRSHHAALTLAREIGDREGELGALLNLGRAHLAVARPERALLQLREGLALAEELQRRPSVREAHRLLSQAFEQAGDTGSALHHYRAYHDTEKALFNEENEQKTRRLTVQFEVERARHEAEEHRLRTEVLKQARDEAEAMVRERTRELEESQLEIASRLAVAAEYRDDDTGEHTRRVGRNAALIARALGRPDDEVALLFTASRLHDVGKIGVGDAILHKPGRLDDDEMALMRGHATIGARILSGGRSRLLVMAEEIAFAHHERWDGKGYPLGLAGEQIPLSARIVAVADVLDALTHARPYKRAWPVEEALAEIRRQSGHHFDPQVVDACLRVFGPDGICPTDPPTDDDHLLCRSEPEPGESDDAEPPAAGRGGGGGNLAERYEQLLLDKTRELEAARREAREVSRRLQKMAFSDPLTELGNRRAFEEDLEVELARAQRQGDRVSVLTLDLDGLKGVNDSAGHERGDELLRAFATTVNRHLLRFGRTYRVGGDEFMAILAHVGSDEQAQVRAALDHAMAAVQAAGFPQASVSAGLACFPAEADTPGDLTRLSDQRMYRDKLRKRRGEVG